jgi:TolB-like protein
VQAALLVLVAALLVAATWFLLPQLTGSSIPVVSSAAPSIAVLPFDNMSGDPEMSYFSDGVSEDIISMLARSPDVSVVARNSSFTYKGKPVDVRQVGKELGVDYVLEGSVRRVGDNVRIIAQLVEAETGEHVWAERFDESGNDPWVLQDEVTGRIIAALAGEKGQLKQAQYRQAWGADTAKLEEYDYYLRGHDLFMRFQPDTHEEAGAVWKEGLSKFSDSALLQIKLGFYHFIRAFNGWSDDPAADFQRADELLKQAFAHAHLSPLERRLGHWLAAYVSSQKRDFDAAIRHAEAARALAPYDAFLVGDLSQILIMAGRPEHAIEWAGAAASNDPANLPLYKQFQGWALTVLGKPNEALELLREATMNFVATPLLRVINLVRLDRLEDAKAELRKAMLIDPTFTQAKWREMFFYSDSSIVDREVADLAKAGLPEA